MQPVNPANLGDFKVAPKPAKVQKPRRIYDPVTEQLITVTGATNRRQRRELQRQVQRAERKSRRAGQ